MKFEYKITLAYLLVGGLWIKFSDKVLDFFVNDPHLLTRLQTYKGWFYVIITGILFYVFLRSHLRKLRDAEAKARESDALKTAFIQNISHEIRTPMNGIVGFAGLLSESGCDDSQKLEYIRIINSCSRQLLNIVNDVLDISMIETGTKKVNLKVFSLNALLDEILTSFRPALYNGVKLILETGLASPDDVINSDSSKIIQVLSNLISNSLKFTERGYIKFGYTFAGKDLEFFVEDTGPGIKKELQHRLFERFIKGESHESRVFEGVGLGLAICKGIVELLGGKIWVDSEPGKGTRFFFTIPYNKSDLEKFNETTSVEKTENFKKMTILLVEDNLPNQIFIREAFKGTQASFIIAVNGQEAVNICMENSNIDLILMDLKMPVMDGYVATAEIRKFNSKVPIIAQTAYALSERDRVLEAGCTGYISKPFRKNELLEVVRQYIKI